MRKTDVPNVLIAIIWVTLLVSGIQGIIGVQAQNVVGYPVVEQLILYIGIPLFFLILCGFSAFLSRRRQWFYNAYPAAVLLCAFALLPTLMVWGGGV